MEREKTPNKENSRVAKAAGVVSAATMLSRIFGFIRDMVIAGFFGAGMATDAFFVAFRIPNLLRKLLAEGSLTVSFVPVFTEYLKKKTHEDACELANVAFTLLTALLTLIAILGVVFAPVIVTVMAPGFVKSPTQYDLAVFLTRLMFPYIFFISLVALCMGILNSLRHFLAPALSPVVLNISMILAALTLRGFFREPVTALAVGVVIGGILQLAMQWPFLIGLGVKLKPDCRFNHPGIRQIGALMLPTFLGSAVYQINVFIGTILASLLPRGSVSYLYYADRLVELPLGVFAIAVGTAALPSFSEQVATGDFENLKKTISFSLRLILFVSIPATLALIALRGPIISVLFERGAFDNQSTILTAQALLYYTVGLWAFSVIRVIDSVFFSIQDRKSPLKAAFVSLFVNVAMSLILMFPLKHGGLALATSLASMVNVAILGFILRKKIGAFLDREFYRSLVGIIASSLVMWGAISLTGHFMPWHDLSSFYLRLRFLTISITVGMATFLACAYLTKNSEMMMLIGTAKKRLGTS
ncbi:MAG: murein biosynthesis integral membrane protein MurJ [Deltaproteobacteria bacterium]|nr:murein biosynthesis integral membrane protein MurJ [Deltaproteobacteria bacterium]